MAMITEIEDYFSKGCGRCARFDTPDCSTRKWVEGLAALRRICRDAGLTETVKWGHPCYMHAGRNIAIIGAFRGDFRLSFFDAALLTDPEAILERQGENTEHPDMMRFTANDLPDASEGVIRAYLREAMGYAEQGVRPAKSETALDLPEELTEALDADPQLAEAFARLTPGRQKGYVLNLRSAKKPETRSARVQKFAPRILKGLGLHDH